MADRDEATGNPDDPDVAYPHAHQRLCLIIEDSAGGSTELTQAPRRTITDRTAMTGAL